VEQFPNFSQNEPLKSSYHRGYAGFPTRLLIYTSHVNLFLNNQECFTGFMILLNLFS